MIPNFQSLMLPLLKLLENGEKHRIRECIDKLADEFNLTEDEKKKLLPSGHEPVFTNRVRWAQTYLKKAGLIESPEKGFIKITERGREALKENHEKIDIKFLMNYKEFKEWMGRERDSTVNDIEKPLSPEEIIDEQFKLYNDVLKGELMEKINSLSSEAFEKLVIDFILKLGYGGSYEDVSTHLGKSGDEGLDGVIKQDVLGMDNIYLQAKKWKDTPVGRPEVQKFVGALTGKGAKKGIFITTSKFSNEAIEYANSLKDIKVVLIDSGTLLEYMIKYNIGVKIDRVLEFKKIDEDYFESL